MPGWLRPGKGKGHALVDPQPLQLTSRSWEPAPAEGWPGGVDVWLAGLQPQGYCRGKDPGTAGAQGGAGRAVLEGGGAMRQLRFDERDLALIEAPWLASQYWRR